jgi:hypothetical protein
VGHQIPLEIIIASRAVSFQTCAIDLMFKKIVVRTVILASEEPELALELQLLQLEVHLEQFVGLYLCFLLALEALREALDLSLNDAVDANY